MDENQKEQKILAALKEWRMKVANEDNLPESMILKDKTLEQISREKPKTRSALMNMGLSSIKVEKYGDDLTRLINEDTGGLKEKEIEKYGEALMGVIGEEKTELREDAVKPAPAPVKENFLTVLQVSEYIKNRLDDPNLNQIYVRGEIKNLSRCPSNHIYFDIQEKNASFNCVFFEYKNKNLDFELEDGTDTFVFGSIQTCMEKGAYQLDVDSVLPAWKGELIVKFEKLKEKLSKEGLFGEEHKKEIPYLYKTLGFIAAKDSKAHDEVVEVLKHRFPVNIKRVLIDTENENASRDIINAIKALNKIEEAGAILIVGDGGSIEKLNCFNDEALARAIFNSRIPIITGIGNETDYTIADLAADKRAPTPAAAAKIAVPDKDEVIDRIAVKKEIPEIRRETPAATPTYVKKEIAPVERSNEISGGENRMKTYKLIALVIMLVLCIIVLIYLISLLL